MINPLTSTNTYWSILKSFLNNKKILCIPPLFHQNRYITKDKDKTELFNNLFADQCSLIKNSSVLPSVLFKRTENVISSIDFGSDDIAKIIQMLDPNKAHGHNMISIRMLKICGNSIYKSLQLIFPSCIENAKFPSEWKKANVVSVHKKGNKQTLENYRPVSLLPICGKIFERLIYNSLFEFFIANELIYSNQSGFKPGDSCINQLLSITHEIYKSFDDGYEVRGVFLDISKGFDKVWYNGLIYKLKQNGVSSNLLNLIIDFLDARKQRVVLNGQYSSWASVKAGVPQGSILGPLFFLIFINDLSGNLVSNPKLFADDTSLVPVVQDITLSAMNLNDDLKKINKWAFQWKMSFNPDPNKQAQEVIFSRKLNKPDHLSLNFNNTVVIQSTTHKHLGMILDTKLDFQEHLKDKLSKISKTIGLLRKLQKILTRPPLLTIYKSFIRPHLDYGTSYMTKHIIAHFIKT